MLQQLPPSSAGSICCVRKAQGCLKWGQRSCSAQPCTAKRFGHIPPLKSHTHTLLLQLALLFYKRCHDKQINPNDCCKAQMKKLLCNSKCPGFREKKKSINTAWSANAVWCLPDADWHFFHFLTSCRKKKKPQHTKPHPRAEIHSPEKTVQSEGWGPPHNPTWYWSQRYPTPKERNMDLHNCCFYWTMDCNC